MTDMTFDTSTNTLTWGTTRYKAMSGGFGKGVLPKGGYAVKTRNVVEGPSLASGFRLNGTAFFIPIEHDSDTTRGGLGIHPDGNTQGTLGCIGLQSGDAAKFWNAWLETPLASRPKRLTVN